MSTPPLSRRSLLKAATLAGGAVAFGLPQALWPSTASAYSLPSKLDWWYQARFGMFIHFGSYSYLGDGEWAFSDKGWSKTDWQNQVTTPFNPANFNAAQIAELAENAGMKYLVITAKHHEGYAMWDSNVAGFKDVTGTKQYNLRDYNNFQPDLLAALRTECLNRGIKFGLYYSIMDWNHPSQTCTPSNWSTSMASATARTGYINDMKGHLQELLDRYDPSLLWFDGDWCDWWSPSDGQDLYNWLIARKPGLVINERIRRDLGLGDYAVAEFGIPETPMERAWEACATMNWAWGYNDERVHYRSVTTHIQELVTIVSRDGNYLLNIGPKGDGSVTPESVNVLNGMASWMSVHADSIHGTSGSPFATEPSWGRITKKNGKLFAHVFNWPTGGTLQIPAVHNTINRVYLLNNPSASLSYTVSGGTINVSVPTTAPNASDSVVCVEVTGMPAVLANGVYRLISAHSGKALDNSNTTAEGNQVVQWTQNTGTTQRWTVTNMEHGYYKLVSVHSGKALDDNNSTAPGTTVVQRTDSGGHRQQWAVTALGNGEFRLVNRHSGLALDNANTTNEGNPVVQWTPGTGATQRWAVNRVS
ncbi:alpha-L-fucosidase [Streptomyces sp. SID5643]|uniref:alpha-L-fucosidase n=1 Tax=Streptomyces sp. SID5643 TaxID=2690307 RepID=UPI001370AC31|nr:alpha-L-fucosidase [Streptomyces sp. SID5643]MZF86043.1 twin-arginine translocation signal domain-containing protein [Streptomyces sp. SID5643]MZF87651.1 twin-arginine translocation signal domain-containing protein [Streptomyces sp. SID5643]